MDEVNLRKHIGAIIKLHRRKKNLTQAELGKKIGVDNSTISSYERGLININLNTLFELTDIFEIKLDDFFPSRSNNDNLENALVNDTSAWELKDLLYMKKLIDFIQKLDKDERTKLIGNIELAVEFFKKDD